jgi:hypothetical protein
MKYVYTAPDLLEWCDKLKAILDILGLRLTPSKIWEAIPFSFVVDWFIRIGDFLEQNEEPLVKAQVTVLDYVISHKTSQTSEREWKWRANQAGTDWQQAIDVTTKVKTYRRDVVLPDSGNTFINQGQYGPTQLALSASLLRCIVGGRR